MMERNLGSGIHWLKVPSVKAVMKALRRRIFSAAVAALPDQDIPASGFAEQPGFAEQTRFAPQTFAGEAALIPGAGEPPSETEGAALQPHNAENADAASPFLAKVCRNLIERLGAEKALEALILLNYGDLLDPDRYGPITEYSEEDFKDPIKNRDERRGGVTRHGRGRMGPGSVQHGTHGTFAPHAPYVTHGTSGKRNRGQHQESRTAGDFTRVYVGQGRQHGLGPRDIAALLTRAGGIPGRLVDEIEMKDYCSFATLPTDAARRACSFSRGDPQAPIIRTAKAIRS
jgi:ATP-dependent RNA helicase DeaD